MVDKNRFRSRVVGAGMTQYELASLIGMCKNTLSSKINGKTPFNTDEIDEICRVLKIEDSAEKANIFLSNSPQKRDIHFEKP